MKKCKNVKNSKDSRSAPPPPIQKESLPDKPIQPSLEKEIASNQMDLQEKSVKSKPDPKHVRKVQSKKKVPREEATEKITKSNNSFVSVDSLYVLKELLEAEEESRNRVIAGVGEGVLVFNLTCK